MIENTSASERGVLQIVFGKVLSNIYQSTTYDLWNEQTKRVRKNVPALNGAIDSYDFITRAWWEMSNGRAYSTLEFTFDYERGGILIQTGGTTLDGYKSPYQFVGLHGLIKPSAFIQYNVMSSPSIDNLISQLQCVAIEAYRTFWESNFVSV